MGAAYNILGKNVPSRYLALGTIATVIGGVQLNSLLGSSEPAKATPAPAPVAASSEGELDVEKAINDFLASNDEQKN